MLIDVEEDLTIGAAGSPCCDAARRCGTASVVVVKVNVAAILARAGVGVARSPSRLEIASDHSLFGGANLEREPRQRTIGHLGTISVANADPESRLLSRLATKVGVGPQIARAPGNKQSCDRAS